MHNHGEVSIRVVTDVEGAAVRVLEGAPDPSGVGEDSLEPPGFHGMIENLRELDGAGRGGVCRVTQPVHGPRELREWRGELVVCQELGPRSHVRFAQVHGVRHTHAMAQHFRMSVADRRMLVHGRIKARARFMRNFVIVRIHEHPIGIEPGEAHPSAVGGAHIEHHPREKIPHEGMSAE